LRLIISIGIVGLLAIVVIGASTSFKILNSETKANAIEDVSMSLNLDHPKICEKLDEPESCVNNFALIKNDPQICVSYLSEEIAVYECINGLIPKLQSEKLCNLVSEEFYNKCMIDVVYWKNN